MNGQVCEREQELLDALGRGLVGPELDAHVTACTACGELRLVAGALLDDRAAAMMEAPIPSAGTMWFRLQLRLRHEATATARRSLLIGQAATLAVAIALLGWFFGSDLLGDVRDMRNLITSVRFSTTILIALAAWLVLAPLASWVAIRQK